MKKKIEYSRPIGFEGTQYIDITTTMKLTNVHRFVLDKMKQSCIKQLNNGKEVRGFLEYDDSIIYDLDTYKNGASEEIDACFDLCFLGVFEQDYDTYNTTFILAESIDWTEI